VAAMARTAITLLGRAAGTECAATPRTAQAAQWTAPTRSVKRGAPPRFSVVTFLINGAAQRVLACLLVVSVADCVAALACFLSDDDDPTENKPVLTTKAKQAGKASNILPAAWWHEDDR
jgi:hypothetical protein